MAETTQDNWHDSRIRPYTRWLAFFGAGWFAFCGVFVLVAEQIAGPMPEDTAVTPLETRIFAWPHTMNLRFGTKYVKILTRNGFIDPRDHAAVEVLATQKLDENARAS